MTTKLSEQEKEAIGKEYLRKLRRKNSRIWRDANREKYNEYQREYRRRYRAAERKAQDGSQT